MVAPSRSSPTAPRAAYALLGLALALAACTRDELNTSPRPNGVRLDAGATRGDGSTGARPDGGARDGGQGGDEDGGIAYLDASTRDGGGGYDAGSPDAGPPCACPQLPAACAMPAASSPSFTPGGSTMLEQLFGAIACAETSIHAALYETSWDCVVDALAAQLAARPALTLQLVIDDDQCPLVNGARMCALQALAGDPRVTILDDSRARYMHHKFYVIDGRVVWVGSANMTQVSFCSDTNNALLIDQPEIVAAYDAEFQRMYDGRAFGPAARTAVSGGPYTVYFGPESPLSEPPQWFARLLAEVGTASTSVEFQVFALTKLEIADALVAAKDRGVRVRGVVAHEFIREAAVLRLIDAGVAVKADNVHDKLLMVDGRLVATGSANWSANAWENDESSLWVDSATIAATYRTRFEAIYRGASPP